MQIVLFDDQLFILEALKRSFQSILYHDTMVTYYTESLPLIDHIMYYFPEIIVFDLITEDDDIIDVIKKTLSVTPTSFVVVYTNVSSQFICDTVLSLGVKLFIHKSMPPHKTAELILNASRNQHL
jgi:DNA-binding NarL/FixJ family response regulator